MIKIKACSHAAERALAARDRQGRRGVRRWRWVVGER
jgi:hypothetical protein